MIWIFGAGFGWAVIEGTLRGPRGPKKRKINHFRFLLDSLNIDILTLSGVFDYFSRSHNIFAIISNRCQIYFDNQ